MTAGVRAAAPRWRSVPGRAPGAGRARPVVEGAHRSARPPGGGTPAAAEAILGHHFSRARIHDQAAAETALPISETTGSGPAAVLRRQTASPQDDRPCAGWEGDRQSISKATADHYLRTEVDPSIVPRAMRIWCSSDPYCIVYYTEDLAVFVSTARVPAYMIAVRYPGSPDRPDPGLPRPRCEYEYDCPGGQITFRTRRCSG